MTKEEKRDLGAETSEEEEDEVLCDCMKNHGYVGCVVCTYPFWKVDKDDLFEQVRARIGDDSLVAPTFDELPAKKKRWCFYWWYAVNIFHYKGKAQELPKCFVKALRGHFKDEGQDQPTGFRSTEERLQD